MGTTIDLDAIEARCNAATRGPWGHKEGTLKQYVFSLDPGEDFGFKLQNQHWEDGRDVPAKANALFVAHARTDLPALVARVRKLEAELGAARERACEQETALSDAAMQIATLQSMLQAAPVYHAARCGLMDPGAYDRQCTCAQGAFLARRAALLGGGAL